jgi:quercetin dioxygenase-like cupin family protein
VQCLLDTPHEWHTVCRGSQLQFFGLENSATLLARLTNLPAPRSMEVVLVRMPPGQRCPGITGRACDEFIYVIAGQVALALNGESFVLHKGDSAHYGSTEPHEWENTAHVESVIVWVSIESAILTDAAVFCTVARVAGGDPRVQGYTRSAHQGADV